ncbi:MAG: M23 family metallopeptidase [Pyrinomonadaceae bacterium]|nr:M23 family metallopeptidase [Pyrinomonadaceae bacterium]
MPKLNNSQRRNVWRHPSVVVKRLSLAVLLLFTFLVLGSATGITAAAERIADKLAGKLVFYVHVAQLYAKEPDQKIAMPVQDVSKSQIANTWHAARGTDRLHEGQDIFAPQGTPVLSATEGYIASIGENRLGGQTVSVVGAGGRVYYYAHLDSYAPHITEGDWVTTQTVLGYVGTTGNAAGTPPHLHFGVYAPGGAMNPLPLLNDRPRPELTGSGKGKTARGKKNR